MKRVREWAGAEDEPNEKYRQTKLFRGLLEIGLSLAFPREVLGRPGMAERIERAGTAEPLRLPGPDRATVLELLAG